jgi:hypothetical protein
VADPEPTEQQLWCVVGNVRPEAFGNASSSGTKHFRAGALIWIYGYRWEGRNRVIGHHRVSHRLIALMEDIGRLADARPPTRVVM